MPLSLKESTAAAAMAEVMYDFLPGSGNARWRGHVTFGSVAAKCDVGAYWQAGSKLPAIIALLERTLQYRRDRFEPLILEIVRSAIVYRKKQGNPITEREIRLLNGHILGVGFKFPSLWDPEFLTSLRQGSTARATEHVEQELREQTLRASALNARSVQLSALKDELIAMHCLGDRSAAGLALEKILNGLFALFGLVPRGSFRVTGEQIDGSFDLHHEIYLVEAKWEKKPLPESDLLVFRGKIEGKSQYTHGLFIALEGISAEAKDAITRGKQPNFFLMTGHDLLMVLSEDIGLVEFLEQRFRLLCEEGAVVVPYTEIWRGSRLHE